MNLAASPPQVPSLTVSPNAEPASWTLSRVFRLWAPEYLRLHGDRMPGRHRMVLRRILQCRTAALGGHGYQCEHCGYFHFGYHSCNDRHCPQCGHQNAQQWLESVRARVLLPVPWFLLTFTVPEPLRRWMRSRQKLGYDLLFAASSQALKDLASNPKRLGVHAGMLGVLHTWSRTLVFHPHVHYLVPAGGLSLDQRQWIGSSPRFLLPVHALSLRFRTLFKEALKKQDPEALDQLPPSIWRQGWVVHSKPAGSGEGALIYLARYVFRTAMGNKRIEGRDAQGRLLLGYQPSDGSARRQLPLEPMELIRRYLQHVLPKGYTRVRYFGWLHPAAKAKLRRVQWLLANKINPNAEEAFNPCASLDVQQEQPQPAPASLCPRCHRPMRPIFELPRSPPSHFP